IVASDAIAPGDSSDESLVIVVQANGNAVEFELAKVFVGITIKSAADTAVKFLKLRRTVRVAKRKHRIPMGYRGEFTGYRSTDPLLWRIDVADLRIRVLQLHQPVHQFDELLVRYLRGIFLIVEIVMVIDLFR